MIEIDTRTFSIPQTQRIWRLFPGTSYQFLGAFLNEKVGFLDFPALKLPQGKLSSASDLISRIALSQSAKSTMQQLGIDAPINENLSSFSDAKHTKSRGRFRQALINFYEEAKAGDLIILPESLVANKVWLGQVASNDVGFSLFARRYGTNRIPSRDIRWIRSYNENSVSSNLSEKLRQVHPFTLLEKSLYPEVFSLAFGSFIYGELKSSVVSNGENFLDTDAAFLGNVSRLAAAACEAIDLGEDGLGKSAILKLILSTPSIQYTCSQEADIHSPGFVRYLSVTIVPLVIVAVAAALITLSQTATPLSLKQEVESLHFINSASDAQPHINAMVSEASKRVLQGLGVDNTWTLCEAARVANDRAALKPSAIRKR